MTDREAMQMALEALELSAVTVDSFKVQQAAQDSITTLRARLEQPEEKPVADVWTGCGECDSIFGCHDGKARCIRLHVEQQAEPVAWVFAPNNELLWPSEVEVTNPIEIDSYQPLYITPPQRKPLTIDDIQKLVLAAHGNADWTVVFARAIEQAHGIKETP